jgi:hypothetical protein
MTPLSYANHRTPVCRAACLPQTSGVTGVYDFVAGSAAGGRRPKWIGKIFKVSEDTRKGMKATQKNQLSRGTNAGMKNNAVTAPSTKKCLRRHSLRLV